MIEYIILLILTYLLLINNIGVCIGLVVGSRIISLRRGIILAIISIATGLVLAGSLMKFRVVNAYPILITGIVSMIIGEILRIPITLIGSLYLAKVGHDVVLQVLEISEVFKVILYWIISPLISLTFSPLILKTLAILNRKFSIRLLRIYKVVAIILTILLCMFFGANNLGFIWSLVNYSLLGLISIILGLLISLTYIPSRSLQFIIKGPYAYSITSSISILLLATTLLIVATYLSIPVSLSFLITYGLLGLVFAYRFRVIDLSFVKQLSLSTIVIAILSLLLGFIFTIVSYIT